MACVCYLPVAALRVGRQRPVCYFYSRTLLVTSAAKLQARSVAPGDCPRRPLMRDFSEMRQGDGAVKQEIQLCYGGQVDEGDLPPIVGLLLAYA